MKCCCGCNCCPYCGQPMTPFAPWVRPPRPWPYLQPVRPVPPLRFGAGAAVAQARRAVGA